MEDTKDFRARLTKLEENVLQWEQRLQSANPGPETFHQMVSELRDSWTTSVESVSNVWRKRARSPTTPWSTTVGSTGSSRWSTRSG